MITIIMLSPGLQFRAEAQAAETWTFMVYMSGEGTLSDKIASDVQEMMRIGSGDGLEIIALMDPSGFEDSSLARVLKNGMENLPISAINATWGRELNMGDPEILVGFVTWAVENYPSDRYMLDLWGHGIGWPGVCLDKGDYLDAAELRQAMQTISGAGMRLDIVSMDACQMGQMEIAYELRHAADYALLSQKDVPLDGWPYDVFLGHLKGDGTVTQKAGAMIDSYISWGRGGNSAYSLTLSLTDLGEMEGLAAALDAYSSEAALAAGYFNPEFIAARSATEKYDGDSQYDLLHLLDNIDSETEHMRLRALSSSVSAALDRCIVHKGHWTRPLGASADNANGLSIWFPSHGPALEYLNTGFAQDTVWPDFLSVMAAYFRQPGRKDAYHPVSASPLDSDGDGLMDSARITVGVGPVLGTTFIDVFGPGNEMHSEHIMETGTPGTYDIALDGIGFYDIALYLRHNDGSLLNYSIAKGLVKERLSVITGRVTSNIDRGLAWVGVNLEDGNGTIITSSFTDSRGYYRMEVVVPTDTDGFGLLLVCGLGSGRKNMTINTLGELNNIDFRMEISSAYIPWVIRTVGLLNLAGLMALVYWAAWGREKQKKKETENLIRQQPIPPQ